jgi:uncharacterized protein (TIGR01370 family)
MLLGLLTAQWGRMVGFVSLGQLTPGFASASNGEPTHVPCGAPESGSDRGASEKRRRRMAESLQDGFGVQYWGSTFTVPNLVAAPHGLLIIETTRSGATATDREASFSREDIRKISHDGQRPVLGYINLAKIETYREYWSETERMLGRVPEKGDLSWIGPSLGEDGTLALYWSPDWQKIVEDRVDRLMSLGVSGLVLEDVLQYYTFAEGVSRKDPAFLGLPPHQTHADFARSMMALVDRAARRARYHDCDALVVVNNGAYIGRDAGPDPEDDRQQVDFDQYRRNLDGILIESVFAKEGDQAAIAVLREDFLEGGIPVLTVDFASAEAAEGVTLGEVKARTTARAAREGFFAYVAKDALFNRLYPASPSRPGTPVLP